VKEWIDQTGKALNLSVNLSSRHFIRTDLVDYIGEVLERTKLSPSRLTLEITETYLVENYEQCRENVTALAHLGVGTAIDDFGTGYSSLSYLRNLDFKTLKIDKQFIRGAGLTNDGSPDSVLVRTILAMARNLGLKTVAEGVETEDHLKFLKEYGCDLVQGFYYTEPLSPLDFASRFLSST
jgi:EAL domain-containing protein (putative c-di-GMP-specific phosphodiesterase class I)